MDFSLFQEKCKGVSSDSPSQVGDRLWLTTRGLNTLDEQCGFLSFVHWLCANVGESAARVWSLQHQMAVHKAGFTSLRRDLTWLEEYFEVVQRQVTDGQSVSLSVEGGSHEYRRRLDIKQQGRGALDALFCSVRSHSVDHSSLIDLVQDFPCRDTDLGLIVYLRAIFAAVRGHTAGFRSATAIIVEMRSVTLPQDFLSILTDADGLLAALASEALVTTTSKPLGLDNTLLWL